VVPFPVRRAHILQERRVRDGRAGQAVRRVRQLQREGRGVRGRGTGPDTGERRPVVQAVPALQGVPGRRLHIRHHRAGGRVVQAHHHGVVGELHQVRVVPFRVQVRAPPGAPGQEEETDRNTAGRGAQQGLGPGHPALPEDQLVPPVGRQALLGEAQVRAPGRPEQPEAKGHQSQTPPPSPSPSQRGA